MTIKCGYLVPHPPLLIPEVGESNLNNVRTTNAAMEKVAQEILELQPEVIFIVTPHGPSFGDVIGLTGASTLKGNFGQFGAGQIKLEASICTPTVKKLHATAQQSALATAILSNDLLRRFSKKACLDHGIMIPLYYLSRAGVSCPIVPIYIGGLSVFEHYQFGSLVAKVTMQEHKQAVFIASGDLSHRLKPDAPAGYSPQGAKFDSLLIEGLREGNFKDIITIDEGLSMAAGECGLRPLATLLGAFEGWQVDTKILSYEGPFGVGYGVASITATKPSPQRELVTQIAEEIKSTTFAKRKGESAPVALARQAIEQYLQTGSVELNFEDNCPQWLLQKQAGAFVSLKKQGQLRGCIGTTAPTQSSLAREIANNAINAAFEDPRFWPVQEHELDGLVISVDVLHEPERISTIEHLDPDNYGVIVEKSNRRGLLLPNLAGVETTKQQVSIACQKAGINSLEGVRLYRFKVDRYE